MASDRTSGTSALDALRSPSDWLDTFAKKFVAGLIVWIVVMVVLGLLTNWHSIALGLVGGGFGVLVVFWLMIEYFDSEI
ncbi:MAG: hypothetical protein ACOC42_03680 [Halobacteriota archaeon]